MRFIIYCILFLSFNCLAENNVEHLGEDEGYVILPLVISGMVPESIILEDSDIFGASYKVKKLKAGENFELIILPAGEYKWSKIKVNKSYYFNLEESEFNLTVKKDKINYGGHLIIDINSQFGTANYNYVNRSSQVIKELEDCCKTLTTQYSLTFTGKSEDPYIEFYRSATTERVN
ncbi:hypothetical protein RI845_07270 [Thalassotalea nanhaiensis]|uniref:DUF2846 domain-containing protein n=1 Tax=Thalassotalea nanhaiensis TaxID=3065648 RepID=A0ABY9TM77_9GAMM|nr:hypothetical protein RI845_07270 [Colwelliaceae bacterium SQ345]